MTGNSKEYATALFSLSTESGCEEQMLEGLTLIQDVFRSTPEMYAFLDSPGIPKSERLGVIREAFANEVPEFALSFLSLLCEKGSVGILSDCVDDYRALFIESRRIVVATVRSAVELTAEEKEKMQKTLSKKAGRTVRTEYTVDPTLLGGVIVHMDGLTIDGSLRRRMQNMKEVMNQ